MTDIIQLSRSSVQRVPSYQLQINANNTKIDIKGWHSNIFCNPIFVLGQDESQGTTTENSG